VSRLVELVRQREVLENLTLRELRTKYRRSFLGWAWSMINPLATIAIFTLVFKVLLRTEPAPGDPSGLNSFALYLLSGLIPWNFYSLVTSLGMGAVVGNPALVRKAHFQREILVLSQVLFAFVQFLIEMGIVLGVLSVFGGPWVFKFVPQVLLLMVMFALFSTGIALALSVVNVYFRDLAYLWTIVLQLSFYATPIVYSTTLVESEVAEPFLTVLTENPLAITIESFRHLLYDGRSVPVPQYLELTMWCAMSLTFGLLVFGKLQKRLAEEV
jgi:lipopolysaccharide transport system permease protein